MPSATRGEGLSGNVLDTLGGRVIFNSFSFSLCNLHFAHRKKRARKIGYRRVSHQRWT